MSPLRVTLWSRVWRWVSAITRLVTAIWWGGLTFYAAIVVPAATDHIGSFAQGAITRDVTVILNGLAVCVTGLAVGESLRKRDRINVIASVLLGSLTVVLIAWHRRLSGMMSADSATLPDGFYQNHAIYLWLTTAQWLCGLLLMLRSGDGLPDATTRDAS